MPLVPVAVVSGSKDQLSKKKDVSLKNVRLPGGGFVSVRTGTVDSENRRRDQVRVERETGLPEFGSPLIFLFFTQGDWRSTQDGEEIPTTLFAKGYTRVVYGDHGPYVELSNQQVLWGAFPLQKPKPDYAFYDERFSQGGDTMIYLQKKYVASKKNPPKDGKWSCNNNREEGYANYVPGMNYVEASAEKLIAVDMRTGRPLSLFGFGWTETPEKPVEGVAVRKRHLSEKLSESSMAELRGMGGSLTGGLGRGGAAEDGSADVLLGAEQSVRKGAGADSRVEGVEDCSAPPGRNVGDDSAPDRREEAPVPVAEESTLKKKKDTPNSRGPPGDSSANEGIREWHSGLEGVGDFSPQMHSGSSRASGSSSSVHHNRPRWRQGYPRKVAA